MKVEPWSAFRSRNRKRSRNARVSSERDLSGGWIVDVNFRDGDPDQELFALDTCQPPHPTVFHERRDLRIVRYATPDAQKLMLLLLLLLQPHEPSGLVVPDLDQVVQGQEALGERDLFQQFARFLLADGFAVVYLGVFSVVRDLLRRHFGEIVQVTSCDEVKLKKEDGAYIDACGGGIGR
ncbi:hypothetical protein F0562_018284 [Nyssa sinensis]|uniref:Uncharacterized protein n=1 Tax=Nyssa sinensis TaxID=561372 RepID=A0A5J4ZAG9_9ASTE|nr:hypothetical protein F0562_018284 [Nyssa sinensis]